MPTRDWRNRKAVHGLVESFGKAPEREGKILVQYKQVLQWFQNRRYAVKKLAEKKTVQSSNEEPSLKRAEARSTANPLEGHDVNMEFEAKSSRDGAWYDVHSFLEHRMLDSGDPEVRVRFVGFGSEDDEWVNVRSAVRLRSLPCEASECVSILPGDLVLCFQEGSEQALYYDAYVRAVERLRHDIRGCRCRFLVQYEHDGSMDVVPLRKVCRRPETDYRVHAKHAQPGNKGTVDTQELAVQRPADLQ